MYIRVASLTPNITNMAQTTYLHVLIDIFDGRVFGNYQTGNLQSGNLQFGNAVI